MKNNKSQTPEEITIEYLWSQSHKLTPFEIDIILREIKSKHIHSTHTGIKFVNKRIREIVNEEKSKY